MELIDLPIEKDYPRSAWDPDADAEDGQPELWSSAPLPDLDPGVAR
jgi:hypothetical protein